jgi:hypothetical protein
VAEILNRKRPLTLGMIRRLHSDWAFRRKCSYSLFGGTETPPDNTVGSWRISAFPIPAARTGGIRGYRSSRRTGVPFSDTLALAISSSA